MKDNAIEEVIVISCTPSMLAEILRDSYLSRCMMSIPNIEKIGESVRRMIMEKKEVDQDHLEGMARMMIVLTESIKVEDLILDLTAEEDKAKDIEVKEAETAEEIVVKELGMIEIVIEE
jgi:hypothetical protein